MIIYVYNYFRCTGLAPPLHENPAEHYVGLASEEESSERFKKLKDNYKENEEKKREDEVYVHLKCMREKTQKMSQSPAFRNILLIINYYLFVFIYLFVYFYLFICLLFFFFFSSTVSTANE